MGDEPRGSLQFRMLGPLEAWRGGTPLRLGGERQRALLALLLVHANELVRTEQLVDELLGEELSDSALNTARVAVSRLRRVLENGDAGQVLVTQAGGYRLKAGPEQLDVVRFERLLADGRRLLAGGDAASAAARLREALALWRGPPLADLALLEFAQPEIRRLEELRLLALMERIDADLVLGANAELIPELEGLVGSNPLQERLGAQLMLALYRAGRQAEALAVYRRTSEMLRDELGLEPGRALQDLERLILEQDASLDLVPAAVARADAVELAVCPFKGLASFDRSDAEYFSGRETAISDLVARAAEASLIGIVGPSGIGKSSLLRAGVLSALRGGVLPGSADWRQVLVRPGQHPGAELARALGGVELAAAVAGLAPDERIVVAVDQLEELFTACADDREQGAFLDQLAEAARDTERRVLVLASLRADFYGRLVPYRRFADLFSRSHMLVGPMTRDELRRAIEQPAARAGLEVEPELVAALVADVEGEPGGLPLLSTALLRLWGARDGRVLRLQSYESTGRVHGAVARLADDAYARLSESEQRVARSVLLRLASGEDESLVRRRVSISELEGISGAKPVIVELTKARLLTVSEGEVEVSHESLLREWPRYRVWLEEDRVGRRLHAHLAASAREWDSHGCDSADLYRGQRLTGALDWSAQNPGELSPIEREFVDRSRVDAERKQRRLRSLLAGVAVLLAISVLAGIFALVKQQSAANSARVALARELGAEAVSEPRIDLAMLLAREAINLDTDRQTEGTLLTTLLRSPAALGTFALPIDARPQSVALSPDGRTLAVTDNNGELWFYDTRTRAVNRTLTDIGELQAPVYSSDGSLLIYGGSEGNAVTVVRDAHTLRLLGKLSYDRRWYALPGADNFASNYLVSPDDRTVFYGYWVINSAGGPRTAYVDRWSLPTGRLLSSTAAGPGPLLAMRLVAGGTRLRVVNATDSVVLDAHSMRRLSTIAITPAPGEHATAAISPDGRTAAIGAATGAVSFVDLATGRSPPAVGGHTASVARVMYSPDGREVVTTGNDNKVIVWDPKTADLLEMLGGHADAVHGAAIGADDQTLYTSSLDGIVLEWDLGSDRRFGHPFATGPGLASGAADTPGTPPLAISPNRATFAVRIGQATVGLFSTQSLREQSSFTIPARGGVLTALAWSPDGAQLAVTGHAGLVQLWSVSGAPRLLRSLTGLGSAGGHPEAVQAVAFGPGGVLLAASDLNESGGPVSDGHVAVWRTATDALLAAPRDLGHPGDSLVFSPDGRQLAVGLDNGPALILDPTNGNIRRTLRPLGSVHGEPLISLAFAPNGTLATGSFAGIVQLWNTATGQAVGHPLHADSLPIASIAFDPSGARFVTTGGSDGTAKLWFTSTLQQEGAALQGDSTTSWGNAAFSSGGRKLIVTYDNGKALEWPVTPASWEQHACAVAGRNLSREEWARFVTDYSYASVCP